MLRPGVQLSTRKQVFIRIKITLIFVGMVVHPASPWWRGLELLGNGQWAISNSVHSLFIDEGPAVVFFFFAFKTLVLHSHVFARKGNTKCLKIFAPEAPSENRTMMWSFRCCCSLYFCLGKLSSSFVYVYNKHIFEKACFTSNSLQNILLYQRDVTCCFLGPQYPTACKKIFPRSGGREPQ